jgi:hypothetical protein
MKNFCLDAQYTPREWNPEAQHRSLVAKSQERLSAICNSPIA